MSNLIDGIMNYQAQIGMHRAGTLSAEPLERLQWYMEEYFQGKSVRNVETGCGASTIVFAQCAAHHTAYCYDDREVDNSSVNVAQNYSGFRHERITWIYGPTSTDHFARPLEQSVDIILLDGPHTAVLSRSLNISRSTSGCIQAASN